MKVLRALSLSLLILLYGMPLPVRADESPDVFVLPDSQVAEVYRMRIEKVLGENYGLKLEAGRRRPSFRWAMLDGEIPPGLSVRPTGTIIGVPKSPREQPYNFRVKVVDISIAGSDALILNFSLKVNAPRIRLSRLNAPRLVPAAAEQSGEAAPMNAAVPDESRREKSSPLTTPTLFQPGTRAVLPQPVSSKVSSDSLLRAEPEREESSRGADVITGDSSLVTIAPAAAVSCSTVCKPTPAPDTKKDYIIDAISGTTRGRTKFGRGDRVRIIVINKNPFLYDYRITIQETPVAEPALAAFLDLLPIGGGTFPAAKPTTSPAGPTVSLGVCPAFIIGMEASLSTQEAGLKTDLTTLSGAFNTAQGEYERVKAVLTNAGSQCPMLCTEADSLQTTLTTYLNTSKSSVEAFEKNVKDFEALANALKAAASRETNCGLQDKLADHYLKVAGELQAKLKELRDGRKAFADMVKSIGVVFSTANAFYDVYERGDFDVPTDVSIKIDRKSKAQPESEFAKLVDTKLNFGGGPRFALAGGLVVSPLEKPEYQRVPAIIDGQTGNIVGFKETSNSRILPILMLHGRLFSRPGWKFVSGIHMSLGLTAKPDNEGTDAEFLIGPSISFIEERLFLTFGGYAGRKQELEGNLRLGQQIPDEFGDELPVSKHYVWKPGFAITYKIK